MKTKTRKNASYKAHIKIIKNYEFSNSNSIQHKEQRNKKNLFSLYSSWNTKGKTKEKLKIIVIVLCMRFHNLDSDYQYFWNTQVLSVTFFVRKCLFWHIFLNFYFQFALDLYSKLYFVDFMLGLKAKKKNGKLRLPSCSM